MGYIQEEFNKSTENFTLSPGEYEGPLVIDHSCVLDGQKSTLWANEGPVLIVDSPYVTLKNIRIEVTGRNEDEQKQVSLKLNNKDTKLENVEINGVAEGLPEENGKWSIPGIIALGEFAANKENSFSIEVVAPRSAEIEHNMKDVVIEPLNIKSGRNVLNITTSSMKDNTILFGELLVKTSVARRVYITGKAQIGAPEHISALPVPATINISSQIQIDPPDEVVAPIVSEDVQVKIVSKGQRISLGQMQANPIKLVYSHKSTKCPLSVDPYIFMLGKNGKVRSDSDLIFFGNEESENKDIRVMTDNDKAFATVELFKVSKDVEKIAVCMSIYEDHSGADFSCVQEPIIRVFSQDKEKFRFALDSLKQEKTVVALEFYRYKGEWKISFVGGGFAVGLESVCREYGVEVE